MDYLKLFFDLLTSGPKYVALIYWPVLAGFTVFGLKKSNEAFREKNSSLRTEVDSLKSNLKADLLLSELTSSPEFEREGRGFFKILENAYKAGNAYESFDLYEEEKNLVPTAFYRFDSYLIGHTQTKEKKVLNLKFWKKIVVNGRPHYYFRYKDYCIRQMSFRKSSYYKIERNELELVEKCTPQKVGATSTGKMVL